MISIFNRFHQKKPVEDSPIILFTKIKTMKFAAYLISTILLVGFIPSTKTSSRNVFCNTIYEKVNVYVEITDDRMGGTYYHALASQTDSSPFYTSDGSHIISGKEDVLRWCALSRDLLNVPSQAKKDKTGKLWRGQYHYGDTIEVAITDGTKGIYTEKIIGRWIVHDVMNYRFRNMVDFLVSRHYLKGGKWYNLKVSKIETKTELIPYIRYESRRIN